MCLSLKTNFTIHISQYILHMQNQNTTLIYLIFFNLTGEKQDPWHTAPYALSHQVISISEFTAVILIISKGRWMDQNNIFEFQAFHVHLVLIHKKHFSFFRPCERPPYMAISDRLAGWPTDQPRQNQELWLVESRNVVSARRSLRLMSSTRWTYAAAGK